MKLIVGLGNPGRIYEKTRHNIGFICLGHFARLHNIKFDKKEGKARTGSGIVAGEAVILAKPQTYMNNSGESVKLLMAKYQLTLADLLVIHDDLDLPPGTIRISQNSGPGGHKGVRSIIECLDSQDFTRLRVGIGRPTLEMHSQFAEDDIIKYVLSDFTDAERKVINEVIPLVSDAILCLLEHGITAAMNRYN
jgi:PTH1 family peptidyl-tRNA hydrolase